MRRQAPRAPGPTAVVIFGASGDLTSRKVVPGLHSLWRSGLLPESTTVVGVARTRLTDKAFRDKLRKGVEKYGRLKPRVGPVWKEFIKNSSYIMGEYDKPEAYGTLKERLSSQCGDLTKANLLFYLATPPSVFPIVARELGRGGLIRSKSGWRRIIVEKPYGRNLSSAKTLNAHIHSVFEERQIYRIDHYLGKETVQNILTLRFANSIFEPIWNRNYIDNVQITVAEDLGVEHRGGYYDQAGVVRDMVQSHLLQLVSLIAMEPPYAFNEQAFRDEKVKLLHAVRKVEVRDAVFGQYVGYRDEPRVEKNSNTATFVALKLRVDNWRWQGVPFYLRTGKRLARKVSEVILKFRRMPLLLFTEDKDISPNHIALCIQPDEGVHLRFETRAAGMGMKTAPANLTFHYKQSGERALPEAYERLLLDAIHGDATLFAREDEVELAWAAVEPLLSFSLDRGPARARVYAVGSWGPPEADELLARDGLSWHIGCSGDSRSPQPRPER